MKRMHVHVSVIDLEASIRFYSELFAAEPTVREVDYAKWMLDDPRVNFAISQRGAAAGIDHLGIQAEDSVKLEEVHARLQRANRPVLEEGGTTCCYAKSDKYWVTDPQGVAWETFHTLGSAPVYGREAPTHTVARAACCGPTDTVVSLPDPTKERVRNCC